MSVISVDGPTCPRCSDLVWDDNQHGTATSGTLSLPADDVSDWTPDVLLATAIGTSLLTTFTRAAAETGLAILGYVAQQSAETSGDICHVHVTPVITVGSHTDAARARALWDRAVDEAPLVRVLSCALHTEPQIVVIAPSDAIDREH